MDKKLKIIIATVIMILLLILIIAGYNPIEENSTKNEISEIDKIGIQIDDSKLNIFCFYVGQADCTLIMNKGQIMLIDAGEESDGVLVTQFLGKIGIQKIDYLIGTHGDDDHIGGMANIVKNFEIEKLYMPKREVDNKAYKELVNVTIQRNLSIENIEKGNIINIRRC